jgi:RimJ/RimL family protein N-acetyltransferase
LNGLWPNPSSRSGTPRIRSERSQVNVGASVPLLRAPVVAELRGRLVRLRPFEAAELQAAWTGLALQDEAAHPRPRPEDRRPRPSASFRHRLERSGTLWRGCLDLAIDRDGRLIGQIQARTTPKQTLPAGVFEIGLVLYRRRDRGKGYGREAVELLTRWLFEAAGAERLQAGTDVGNTAMRAVLEHLGFRLEGVLRAYGPMSDGTRRDGAMYSILRSEWVAGLSSG